MKDLWFPIFVILLVGTVFTLIFSLISSDKEESSNLDDLCQESCGTYGLHTRSSKNNKLYCICGGPEGPIVNEINLE